MSKIAEKKVKTDRKNVKNGRQTLQKNQQDLKKATKAVFLYSVRKEYYNTELAASDQKV